MFCHKCGTQLVDGATFCQKCGVKTVNPDQASAPTEASPKPATPTPPADPAAAQPAPQPPSQPAPQPAAQPAQQWTAEPQYAVPSPVAPVEKKKSKTPFIIIGAVVLVFAAVLVVVLNWEGQTDYIATVKAHTPFVSQDLEYTYQEVLDKYLPGAEWISQKTDSGSDVTVNGKLAGTQAQTTILIAANDDPDNEDILLMRPQSVQVDSCQTSDQTCAVDFLLALFLAYDKEYETVPDVPELLLALGMPEEVELTETYANEDEGISFQYPSAWKPFSSQEMKEMGADDSTLAAFANVVDFFPELSSGIELLKFEDSQEAVDVLYLDDEEFTKTWSSKITISETSLMEIDGVPVRKLIYTEEDGSRYRSYLYSNGSTIYRINFMRSGVAGDDLADYFDAIMDTYTVAMPKPTPTPAPTPSPTPVPKPNPTKAPDIPVVTSIDVTFRGESLVVWCQGPADISYDIFGWPDEGTVIDGSITSGGSKYSAYNEGVMFLIEDQSNSVGDFQYIYGVIADADAVLANGVTLDKNQDEVISVLGEPDEIDSYLDENEALRYCLYYDLGEAVLVIESSGPYEKAHTVYVTPN